MTARIYDTRRLRFPLKRVGPKGEGRFERITWDEAIKTITDRWKTLIETDGPESILPYSFYGNMGRLNAEGMDRRFFHRMGASRLDRTICRSAGAAGYTYTMGGSFGVNPEDTVHAKLIIFWGINAVSTNMHQVALAQQARKNGAKIIAIDVHKNRTGRFADWFIPVMPGTDSALALGIMHVLFAEDMADRAFLEQYTVGHRELRSHVSQYDPATVSAITKVPEADIYRLARVYGRTSPAFIRIGNGLQHHDHGGMCVRTIACLPALTGQWIVKGGGAIKANSSFTAPDTDALQRPDLLKNKKTRVINMNVLGEALLKTQHPPIRSLFVYGANPAVVVPNSNKVREGLLRGDLFTVVHDLFLTETAKYADIVLPATSSFENTDLYTSYWHLYVQMQQPVIERYGESKSNVDVFRLLAKAMGYEDQTLNDSEEEMIGQTLGSPKNPRLRGITFGSLLNDQYAKVSATPLFPGKLSTPSGKIELYSRAMEKDGILRCPLICPLSKRAICPFYLCPVQPITF